MEKNLFAGIVDDIYIETSDCIKKGVADYKEIIEKIFELTDGLLTMNRFEGLELNNGKSNLNLIINNKPHSFEVSAGEFFDLELLSGFNVILLVEHPEQNKYLVDLSSGIHNFGIGFIDDNIRYRLSKRNLIWRDEEWMKFYEHKNNIDLSFLDQKHLEVWQVSFAEDNHPMQIASIYLLIDEKDNDGNIKGTVEMQHNNETKLAIKHHVMGIISQEIIDFELFPNMIQLVEYYMEHFNMKASDININPYTIAYKGAFIEDTNAMGTWITNAFKVRVKEQIISIKQTEGQWTMKKIN